MQFNKKLKNDSQDNNQEKRNDNKYRRNRLNMKTEENKYDNNDETENLCTDCQYSKYKECAYHRNANSMPKKYINNYKAYPANE